MAILNGLYIHVVKENMWREARGASHPVEEGIPATDMIRVMAMSLSLTGKIIDYGDVKASEVIAKIQAWQESGALLLYQGRNVASSMQIRSFESDHPNTNNGGADFSMTLEQVRIAKSAYTPKNTGSSDSSDSSSGGKDKITNNLKKIAVGDLVVFKGGSVYKSSDAKKAAATRKRSTCKVTKISTKSYSVHQYHLKSTDGKKVNGWVDKANIEGVVGTGTSGTTNAGTQQTSNNSINSGSAVYHSVKKGDTLWTLVNEKYKHLGKDVQWVMDNNPKAFTTKGDATTLKVGAKLLMGYK